MRTQTDQLRACEDEGAISPFVVDRLDRIEQSLERAAITHRAGGIPLVYDWKDVRWMLDIITQQATEIARLKRNEKP